jgi:hypothetical protein
MSGQKHPSTGSRPRVPEHLTNELFEDLHRATVLSYERTRALIKTQPAVSDKQDTLWRELDAWTYDVYMQIRNSLRERAQSAILLDQGAEPFAIWKSIQEQVGIVLSRAFAYSRTQVAIPIPRIPKVCDLDSRSRCSACAFARWVRDCSREWLRLACEDPVSGIGVFIDWRAPAWAAKDYRNRAEAGLTIDTRASVSATESLIERGAAAFRSALQNSLHDAFEWFIQQPQFSWAPTFNSPLRKAIAKLLIEYPHAKDLEIVERLDDDGERPPAGWKCEIASFGWAWANGHRSKIEHHISAVRTRLRNI